MRVSRAIFLFCTAVVAWDPSHRKCSSESILCMTSFQWCAPFGNRDGQRGCSPPAEGGYLRGSDSQDANSHYAILRSGTTYNVTWTTKADYPVRLYWNFGNRAQWEVNTTESFFLFKPSDIFKEFPTPSAPNLDPDTAVALAKDWFGRLWISQPEHPALDSHGNIPMDYSECFSVQQGSMIEPFFKNAAATESGRWKRRVSIGVGVGIGAGVPILMAVSAWIGWRYGKKGGRKAG